MEHAGLAGFLLLLICAAAQDVRRRSVCAGIFLFFGAAGIPFWIWRILAGGEGLAVLAAFVPGLLLLGGSRLTGGALGEGDAWFALTAALYQRFSALAFVLLSGIFLSGLLAACVLAVGYARGQKDHPAAALYASGSAVPFALKSKPQKLGMVGGLAV